jgi:hypothetical protein
MAEDGLDLDLDVIDEAADAAHQTEPRDEQHDLEDGGGQRRDSDDTQKHGRPGVHTTSPEVAWS